MLTAYSVDSSGNPFYFCYLCRIILSAILVTMGYSPTRLVFASGSLGSGMSAGFRNGLVLVGYEMGPLCPTRLSHLGWDPFRLGRNHCPLRVEGRREERRLKC